MPDDSSALKEISAELKKHADLIAKILEALAKTGKQIKVNNEDTSKYTGMLKSIHSLHDTLLGGVSKEARIVYNLLHKYTSDTSKMTKDAGKTLTDASDKASQKAKSALDGQRSQLDALKARYEDISAMAQATGTEEHPSVIAQKRSLLNQGRALSDSLADTEEGAEAVAESTTGVAEGMGEAAVAAGGFETALLAAGPELELLVAFASGVAVELSHALDDSYAFNKAMIGANSTTEARDRLFKSTLETSLELGVSQKDVTEIMASMVSHGQQFSNDLGESVRIAVMLNKGLGVSADTTALLLATSRKTNQSYSDLADTISRIHTGLGLSAEEASKMAISINRSLAFFSPQKPNEVSKLLGLESPYGAALNLAGDDDQIESLQNLLDLARKPGMFSFMGGGMSGATPDQVLAKMLPLIEQASNQIHNIPQPMQDLLAPSIERQFGLDPAQFDTLIRVLGPDMAARRHLMDINPIYRQQQELNDAFQNQWSKSQPVLQKLSDSWEALRTRATLPLIDAFARLAQSLNEHWPTIEKSVMTGVELISHPRLAGWDVDANLLTLGGLFDPFGIKKSADDALAKAVKENTEALVTANTLAQNEQENRGSGVAFHAADTKVSWTIDSHGWATLHEVASKIDDQTKVMQAVHKASTTAIVNSNKTSTATLVKSNKTTVTDQAMLNGSKARATAGVPGVEGP